MSTSMTSTAKINLLFVNHSMGMGGIERMIVEMVSGLENDKYSVQVAVFEGGGVLEQDLQRAEVPVHVFDKKEGIDLFLFFKLIRFIKEQKIHVVHSNNYSAWLYSAVAALFCCGTRVVYTAHSNETAKKKHRFILEKCLTYFTDSVVTVSDQVRKVMIEDSGIDSNNIQVVPNGVDTKRFAKNAVVGGQVRKSLGINNSDIVLGTIGRLVPVKDHKTMITALALITSLRSDIKLIIVGDGILRDELEQFVRGAKVENNVIFAGEQEDVSPYYCAMDIYMVSSISEGMSLSILEAMSSALPVIATDVGGNPQLVKNHVSGLLTPVGDADTMHLKVLELVEDEKKREAMGSEGRAVVESHFSKSAMIARYSSLYEKAHRSGT